MTGNSQGYKLAISVFSSAIFLSSGVPECLIFSCTQKQKDHMAHTCICTALHLFFHYLLTYIAIYYFCTDQFVASTSPSPRATPTPSGIWTFPIFGGHTPLPQFPKAVQMLHMYGLLDGQMPHHWAIFFLRLTGQDCFKTIICYKYQLAFSIHVGKRIFVLPFKCISEFLHPIFGQGDKHNILSAINQYHLTFSLPGGARMLRLQIDRYISNICQHYNLLPDRSLNAFSINNIQCNDTIFCPS